jgi:hypothetical protein
MNHGFPNKHSFRPCRVVFFRFVVSSPRTSDGGGCFACGVKECRQSNLPSTTEKVRRYHSACTTKSMRTEKFRYPDILRLGLCLLSRSKEVTKPRLAMFYSATILKPGGAWRKMWRRRRQVSSGARLGNRLCVQPQGYSPSYLQ